MLNLCLGIDTILNLEQDKVGIVCTLIAELAIGILDYLRVRYNCYIVYCFNW